MRTVAGGEEHGAQPARRKIGVGEVALFKGAVRKGTLREVGAQPLALRKEDAAEGGAGKVRGGEVAAFKDAVRKVRAPPLRLRKGTGGKFHARKGGALGAQPVQRSAYSCAADALFLCKPRRELFIAELFGGLRVLRLFDLHRHTIHPQRGKSNCFPPLFPAARGGAGD